MAQIKQFTIDKVGWHTKTPGNTESKERIHARFRAVIHFLQDNSLTNRPILGDGDVIDDETNIHTDALTSKGRIVMEECYHKWLRKVDKGLNPEDISMFKNTLSHL